MIIVIDIFENRFCFLRNLNQSSCTKKMAYICFILEFMPNILKNFQIITLQNNFLVLGMTDLVGSLGFEYNMIAIWFIMKY